MRFIPLLIVALVGCTPEDEGPIPPTLSITPSILDFGTINVGSQSEQVITIANDGEGVITPLSATLVLGSGTNWLVVRDEVDEIGAFDYATVNVTFTPTDVIEFTGNVAIRTDFSDDPVNVELVGSGAAVSQDADGDGFTEAQGDCDDEDPAINPAAAELCDGIDNDCDDEMLSDETDDDGDGVLGCEGDCDDDDPNRYPGAAEVCDGIDNDCDGQPDNADADNDGFTPCDGDCDDGDSGRHPGAVERCNNLDDDCDGALSPGELDADNDGVSSCAGDCAVNDPAIYPGAVDICNGVDNDCNGIEDDGDGDGDGHLACDDCDDADANAYEVYVSPSGNGGAAGTIQDPYDTLQTALANIDQVCRIVHLTTGVHSGVSATWSSGSVQILGETGDPTDVELVAAPGSRHLDISGGAVDLSGVTLSGGSTAGDGGALRSVGADLTVTDVVITGCSADDGGGVYASGGTLTLHDSELRGNSGSDGGGLFLEDAGTYSVERVRFFQNHADDDGGGLTLNNVADPTGSIRNNRIQDNTADGTGGGFAVTGTSCEAAFHNNAITGNQSLGEGAAIGVDATSAAGLVAYGNIALGSVGLSAIYTQVGSGVQLMWTTSASSPGLLYAGEVGDGFGDPVDPTNVIRTPMFTAFTDNGNPDDDDLTLAMGSPEIDDGPTDAAFDDRDGTRNDRGFTGGPAAP